MKTLFLLLLITLAFQSCQNEQTVVNNDGIIHESEIVVTPIKKHDSLGRTVYYSLFVDSLPIRNIEEYIYFDTTINVEHIKYWDTNWLDMVGYNPTFNEQGALVKNRTWLYIEKKESLQRMEVIFFDSLGNIDYDRSNFIKMLPINDTISIEDDLVREASIHVSNEIEYDSLHLYYSIDERFSPENIINYVPIEYIKKDKNIIQLTVEKSRLSESVRMNLIFVIYFTNKETLIGQKMYIVKRFWSKNS
jgi:hypothetical protein